MWNKGLLKILPFLDFVTGTFVTENCIISCTNPKMCVPEKG